jgi:hypothetical protein
MKQKELPPVLAATLAWHRAKRLGLSEQIVAALRAEAERTADEWERQRAATLALHWRPQQRTLWELGR